MLRRTFCKATLATAVATATNGGYTAASSVARASVTVDTIDAGFPEAFSVSRNPAAVLDTWGPVYDAIPTVS